MDNQHYAALMSVTQLALKFKEELKRIEGLRPTAQTGGGHAMGSREFSMANTKIDEALLWARAGIEK